MLSALRSLWIWAATGTMVIVWCGVMAAVWLFDRDPYRRRTARCFRRLGRIAARINSGWHLHLSGTRYHYPEEVFVVVSNHQSLADIPLIAHVNLDMKWAAKKELFRVPVLGWMLSMSSDMPVERSSRRQGAQVLLMAARYLRGGCSCIFFPEGTRSKDGALLPFSDGPFHLAIREQVPVLPLAVDGTLECLPKNSWVFSGEQEIYLAVLPPVLTTGMETKDAAKLKEMVRDRIAQQLSEWRGEPIPEARTNAG
jgi:1-acyl-sn-glycerol-3-phosphate acyltransferase